MNKTDYDEKMDALVNDKQTYELLKRDPTPSLQRKLNNKIFSMRKANMINLHIYYRLRCSVPRPPKLYGLPKLHKPQIPMRPIVSFCGSPTYELSKYLTTILEPLTTNHNTNYSPLKPSSTPTKPYKYKTGVFWCEITIYMQYCTATGTRLHWNHH